MATDNLLEGLRERVREFPQTPGVYLMKSAAEKIIYVGKAKNLRARVRSYFGEGQQSPKTKFLVRQIHSIDTLLTQTEVEAFLLEASLIKKHRPRYNIRLKDDKSYPYIRMSTTDEFPRLYLARKVKRDGSLYFGPYTNGTAVWETMRVLQRVFRLRDCSDGFFRARKRPCLTHEIGRCSAPCVGFIGEALYAEDVGRVVAFLRGKNRTLIKDLTRQMKQASDGEHYETAVRFRDAIAAIERVLERQAMVDTGKESDQDAVSFHGDARGTLVEVIHVRSGHVIGSRKHFLPLLDCTANEEDPREWLASFINQYYDEAVIPEELLLPIDLGHDIMKLLSEVLESRSGREVKVRFPTEDRGSRLVELAHTNAESHFSDHVNKSALKDEALGEIQERLGLARRPARIECYDISNFQGAETVASQVVFEDGVPNKDEYRRYKIRTVTGIDDFASMREVLERRFQHSDWEEPDLVVIDGGKGQLNAAVDILRELGRSDVAVVGLAKSRTQGAFSDSEVAMSDERVFIPNRANPVVFRTNSEAFRILVSIRDEAHRFAITYHRKLRENTSLESELDHIPGLGARRKKALLTKFASLDDVRAASIEEVASLPGFNRSIAESVLESLRAQELSEADTDDTPK